MTDKTSPPPVRYDLDWTPWKPLYPTKDLSYISKGSGIYRVSHVETGGVEYVGRSYSNLRARIRTLGYEIDEYSGAHIAAPMLQDLKTQLGPGFIVSRKEIPSGSIGEIDGKWSAYLAMYRATVGRSPTGNFGKKIRILGDLPKDYTAIDYKSDISTFEGFRKDFDELPEDPRPDGFSDYREHSSKEILISWDNWNNVTSSNWMGLTWEDSITFDEFVSYFPSSSGVYRVWQEGANELDIIEATSDLRKRIGERAEEIDSDALVSYVEIDVRGRPTQTEIEVDLAGAHYIARQTLPDIPYRREPTSTNIEDLVERSEDSDVEFKDPRSDPDDIVEEIVAFSNDGGGNILIGVSDDGNIIEIDDINTKENQITNKLFDSVNPPLRVRTWRPMYEGSRVLWIEVPPAKHCLYSIDGVFKTRTATRIGGMTWRDIEEFISQNPETVPLDDETPTDNPRES